MATKKSKKKKLSAEEITLADQQWAELEAALDREMLILAPSRIEAGRILYEMKRLLKRFGLNKGRRGRWQAVCDKHKIDRKSGENWIRLYQDYADIPADRMVVAPVKKPQQNGQKNTVEHTALLQVDGCKPDVDTADEENADKSPEGRMAVECVFCLTLDQKRLFMNAVQKLGPLRATQLMYQSVVSEGAGA